MKMRTKQDWTTDETQKLRTLVDDLISDGTCSSKSGANGAFCHVAANSVEMLKRDIGSSAIEKRYYGHTGTKSKNSAITTTSTNSEVGQDKITLLEQIINQNDRILDFLLP